jgi:hypothetical protein
MVVLKGISHLVNRHLSGDIAMVCARARQFSSVSSTMPA